MDKKLDIVTDTLIVYLYKISKACISDSGNCQALAAYLLADYRKANGTDDNLYIILILAFLNEFFKGHDVQAFKLYADSFFLSQSKPWLQADGRKLSEAAAESLFGYYITWGQSQNVPLVAEDFFFKARKMAEFTRKEDLRAIAACYLTEVNSFLEHLDPEGSRAELKNLKSRSKADKVYTEELQQLFGWAEAMIMLRENKYDEASRNIRTYIKYLQTFDNCYQVHKAYRELALIYERVGRTNIALEVFKAAWRTHRRAPALPDAEDITLKVTGSEFLKPKYDGIDFVTYIKHVYANIHEKDRRKRALTICKVFLELAKQAEQELGTEGFRGVLMEGDLMPLIDYEISQDVGKTESEFSKTMYF
ncbi:hypothetical protein BV898_05213 [Hypsibius exemplaris]|uniref:Tetratricopeptide repeat protein n=1 Tax=Hypsibius exemplaris TaxID=2072580 RepID=A0A1W0X077_HYPEX|nr:hypothetical protein BV898_05213 [Hypsibius exemplaris]